MDAVLAILIGLLVRFGIPIAVLTLLSLAYSRRQMRHGH